MRERMRELGGSLEIDLIDQGLQLSFAFLSRGLPLIPNTMVNQLTVFLLHNG